MSILFPPADGITLDAHGEPVIAGTSIPVRELRGYEVPGHLNWLNDVLADYPELTPPQVYRAIRYYDDHRWALQALDAAEAAERRSA